MDQFLPGDISVMVLRYLASSGCESTVFSMIGEMPVMKFYVPGQPPGLSNSEYVRMLGRPSLSPRLNDILNDYGQAKLCVHEATTKQSSYGVTTSCDSLSTQLKQFLQSLENSKEIKSRDSSNVCPKVSKEFRDCGTNTDFEEVIDNRRVLGVEVETQTDFVQMIQVASADGGASVDVPLMFYNTLMTDSSLQEKLATAINQRFADTTGPSSKNEVFKKASSTAETEIDRFLVDLLQDDDSCEDIGLGFIPSFSTGFTPVKEEQPNPVICGIDTSLSSLFQDAHSLIAYELPKTISVSQPSVNDPDLGKKSVSFNLELVSAPAAVNVEVESASVESVNTPFKDEQEQPKAGPSRTASYVPKKRVNLKPAPIVQPNPVFEKVQLVERTFTNDGQPYSVHTTRPVISNWEKLGRKPITPKIPCPGPGSHNQVNSTPIKIINELKVSANTEIVSSQKMTVFNGPNKRKARLTTPIKLTPEKAKNSDFNFVLVCHEPVRQTSSSDSVPIPVKAQADDAGLHTHKQAVVDDYANSPEELSPILGRISQTPADKPLEILALKNSNIQVTPILDLPDETMHQSIPKSTSSRAKRPFLSAQKIRATSTQFLLARKSFSSPRKKKHVRSLQFTTPPRLKAKTRAAEVSPLSSKIATNSQGTSLPSSLPQKRKCNDTLKNEGKSKSKKRLHLNSEEDGYQSSAFPDRNFSMKKMTDSMIESAKRVFTTKDVNSAIKEVQNLTDLRCSELTSTIGFETVNHQQIGELFNTNSIIQPPVPDFENKKGNRSKINKLPKILEESLSSLPESTKVSVVDAPVFSSSPAPFSASKTLYSQTNQPLEAPNHLQTFTLHILENSNLSNPELTVVSESPIKSTPLRNEPVPFSILPPISFPDPTPTKVEEPSELMTKNSSHALITPMKSDSSGTTDSNVTFPIPPTPTPRYIVGEPDTDSNTAMSFGKMETLYLATLCNSTPSKLLGPPPTPGKSFGRHISSSSNIVGTSSLNHLDIQTAPVKTVERPLDLSSPIASHRKAESLDSLSQTLPTVDARTATFLVAEKPPEKNTHHKGGEFQVPLGAPKRVSPTGPPNRRQALIRNQSGNLISPKLATPRGGSTALAVPGTTFYVGAATKTLSMSECHSLLNLSSDIHQGSIRRERSPNVPKADPSKFKSFLKNLDVNNFLSKMHRPNLNS